MRFPAPLPLTASLSAFWLVACSPNAELHPEAAYGDRPPASLGKSPTAPAGTQHRRPARSTPKPAPPSAGLQGPASLEPTLQGPAPLGPTQQDTAAVSAQAATPHLLFPGQETVTYEDFIEELRRVADELAQAPEVQKGYQALLEEYQLTPADVSPESYSRVRAIFEATRDGGLWGVRWDITNRMPWSDAIWQQWRERDWEGEVPEITAVAECDELSALFSFLVRDVGVDGYVGLFWPTWNHTVAVWQIERNASQADRSTFVRILVPTSQVWLSREASLGTREFKTNRVIFPYARRDMKPGAELPAPLARYLIEQLRRHGALSNESLLERRNRLGGS